MQDFIDDIKTKLNIKGGRFIDAEIEEHINSIDKSQHLEFFKALSGDEYQYKNAMDRISIVANRFKNEKTDSILAGTREQAKEMYNKFYYESCAMLDYTQKNRDKVPNDREFFRNVPHGELKRTDGSPVYTKQELFVLNALGGGEWLIDIRLALSSKDVVDKIEKIIREAVLTKYNNQSRIENKRVVQMLKR